MGRRIPSITVHYGKVLDLMFEFGDQRVFVSQWRGWHMLVAERALDTAPGRVKLYLVKGSLGRRKLLQGDEHDRAQDQYERWHQRDALQVGQIANIPDAIDYRQGRVLRLGYRSDKWSRRGHMTDYDHDFTERGGMPPWLYTDTRNIERAHAAVIVGGSMAVTEGGID